MPLVLLMFLESALERLWKIEPHAMHLYLCSTADCMIYSNKTA